MLTFFFFNDTATTEIYTLSLHDALPISLKAIWQSIVPDLKDLRAFLETGRSAKYDDEKILGRWNLDRKSTRLNSSHDQISYAVFCLKKKKRPQKRRAMQQRFLHRHAGGV